MVTTSWLQQVHDWLEYLHGSDLVLSARADVDTARTCEAKRQAQRRLERRCDWLGRERLEEVTA